VKLRIAIKVCREVYEYGMSQRRNRFAAHFWKKRAWKTIGEARRICLRRRENRRVPVCIPSDDERDQQAEIFGCLMIDLTESLGLASPEECEAKKTEFLRAMEDGP
jgi:hypothetical protein